MLKYNEITHTCHENIKQNSGEHLWMVFKTDFFSKSFHIPCQVKPLNLHQQKKIILQLDNQI